MSPTLIDFEHLKEPELFDSRKMSVLQKKTITEKLVSGDIPTLGEEYSKLLLKEYETTGNGTEHLGLWGVLDGDCTPMLSYFSKVLQRNGKSWGREKDFYSEIGDLINLPNFKVPEYYGSKLLSNGSLELYIEFCADYGWIKTLDHKIFAASQFGQFSAELATRPDLYRDLNLNRTPGCRVSLPTESLDSISAKVYEKSEKRKKSVDSLKRFVACANELKSMYFSFPETMIHADANDCNLLVNRDVSSLLVVDWGQIAIGRLGEDLCRIFSPWSVFQKDMESESDLLELEGKLYSAYENGVQCRSDKFSDDDIRLPYEIRSVSFGISILRFYDDIISKKDFEVGDGRLVKCIESYIIFLANRAEYLLDTHVELTNKAQR